ncbi:hypothetical protein OQA88_7002 [Cercophora sp. LCS_1]
MAPIRVGIIGLGAQSGAFGPGFWGVQAHLPHLQASPAYEIVALCNSSAESARKSIEFHKLPATTAAYGNAEDLAKDPNVDLVVVSVQVQKHFQLAKPAIQHGKDVFVEWPLGASIQESEELTRLAKEAGVKTMVGVQARASRLVVAVKRLLAEGKIGKVISSHVLGNACLLPVDVWWEGTEYYQDMKSGGNEFYIHFGHFLDSFVDALGDFDTLQSTLSTQWPTIALLNATGEVVNPAYPRTSPDHILVQGKLESGAVASISFRHTKSAVDKTCIKWIIAGTDGEIEVTLAERLGAMESQWQVASPSFKLTVRVGREEVGEFDLSSVSDDLVAEGLDVVALNTGLLYEAFAKGDESRYASFETALKTHQLLERIVKAAGWD